MDVERAIAYGQQAAEFGVMFLEQPVKAADIDGMARIAASIPIPVCPDESVKSLKNVEDMIARKAGSGAVLRLAKFGGLGKLHRAAARCAALGWKVNLPGKIAESSLALAGLLHVAAAAPTLDWFVTPTNHYLAVDLVKQALTQKDGAFEVSSRPGLGVTPDVAVLKEYLRR
jgi:L-alanine-DL-glutamate epimerase-like enolase superfamily enzyme